MTFPYHINLGVGVAHVAHNTTVLHTVHVLSNHHVFVSYGHHMHNEKLSTLPSRKLLCFVKWQIDKVLKDERCLTLTCAGNDDIDLSDDLVEFDQPEAVHAAW